MVQNSSKQPVTIPPQATTTIQTAATHTKGKEGTHKPAKNAKNNFQPEERTSKEFINKKTCQVQQFHKFTTPTIFITKTQSHNTNPNRQIIKESIFF